MVNRLSLAGKYAQFQKEEESKNFQLSPPPLRLRTSLLASPLISRYQKLDRTKRSPITYKYLSYDSTKRASPYVNDVRKLKVSGQFGSPIKVVSTPMRSKRPSRLYKVLPYRELPRRTGRTEFTNHSYGVRKDRAWEEKKTGRPSNGGIFNRFRQFISKFSIEAHEQDNTDYKTLSESAKGLLDIPEMPVEEPIRRTVNFEDVRVKTPPDRRNVYPLDDVDEVDTRVRLAKNVREEERRSAEQRELRALIEEERSKSKAMRERYERQLSLMKQEHEDSIQSLSLKIRELSRKASERYNEISHEKLVEIQNTVLKENESFLIHQKATEELFENLQKRIEQRETELDKREERLQELTSKLHQPKEKSQEDTVLEMVTSSPKIDQLVDRIKISRIIDQYKHEYDSTAVALRLDLETVSESIRTNELEVIRFYDTMQRISEKILQKKDRPSHSEKKLLDNLERLVASLDEHINHPPKPNEELTARFEEYSGFFNDFNATYSKSYLKAKRVYNDEILDGISESFAKLKSSLFGKFVKRATLLRDLDSQFQRVRVDEFDYVNYKVEQVVKILQRRTEALAQQKNTVDMLQSLNVLLKKLNDIRVILDNHQE